MNETVPPCRSDAFSVARVNEAVAGTLFHGRLHHFLTIGSTNSQALADAQVGAEAGQVYIADEQTAGRGRGGHTWHSEPERGLYLTVLVKPFLRSSQVLQLSLAAALAASQAIRQVTALHIDLRWPNDLVYGAQPARKLGGILTEAVSTPAGDLRYAAIGIGVNLNQLNFPAELRDTATSLRAQTERAVSREALAIALLRTLHAELDRLCYAAGAAALFLRFAQASSWVTGKPVRVDEDGGYTGLTAGLTAVGLLRVRCEDGTERTVRHGGVREL